VYYCIYLPLVIFPIYLCYITIALSKSLYIFVLYLRSHFVPKIIRINTPQQKRPRRTVTTRDQSTSTSAKKSHDTDVKVTGRKPSTKRVRGYGKRKLYVQKKIKTKSMVATQRKQQTVDESDLEASKTMDTKPHADPQEPTTGSNLEVDEEMNAQALAAHKNQQRAFSAKGLSPSLKSIQKRRN
jgi:hypothetical protein